MQLTPRLADRVAAILAALDPPAPWALAVSGGPDSMALLRLIAARTEAPRPLVLTVDHGLRPDAAAETRQVAAWAADQGLACRVLALAGPAPASGLQSWARQARYEALSAAALAAGCQSLFTAHTADDQAETVAMRAAHGSGDLGLAGMVSQTSLGRVRLVRPLLTTAKADLAAALAILGQPFVTDPSNQDTRFERARLRQGGVPPLDTAGLTALQCRRFNLEQAACRFFAQSAHGDGSAALVIVRRDLATLDDATLDVVLAAALRLCGGRPYPGTRAERGRLAAAIRSDGAFPGRTLAGVRLRREAGSRRSSAGERLLLTQETSGNRLPDGLWLPYAHYPQLLADGSFTTPSTKFYPLFAR